MDIGKAHIDDMEHIQRLMSTYFLDMDGLSIEDFIVARRGDKVVGCAASIDGKYPEIHSVAVHPSYRSRGIGLALVKHIISSAPQGWEHIYARTTSPLFFEKLGFSRLPDTDKKKLWEDCAACDRFEGCRQSAMVFWIKV